MIINYFRRKVRAYMLKKSISKNSILKGKNYIFESGARVILQDGSSKNDIVLGDNVRLSGTIFSQNKGKVVIGNNTIIGSNSKIFCLESIRIGNYCAISTGITIVDNNNHPVNPEFRLFWRMNNGKFGTNLWIHSSFAPIIIEDNVWIGENARICKGVTIGKNAIVAACAVVTKNVPPNTIVAGNPAKVVKTDIDQIPPPNTNAHFNEYLKSKAK